ncbi:MAG TPA: type II toxin-antitoxin system VapC family toxin [Steroidobacteraceae bacterium]|jgi:predicted nucleic acid-binding protein
MSRFLPDRNVLIGLRELRLVVPDARSKAIRRRIADKALLLRAAILDEAVHALLPALWLYEVGNTVARPFPTHASGWLSALMKFGLEEALPSPTWLAKTLELTSRYEVSFYDAAYHALALIQNGLFVTADTRYVSRVTESGSVIALSDWQPPRTPSSRRRS